MAAIFSYPLEMTRVSVEDEAKKCRKRKRGPAPIGAVNEVLKQIEKRTDEETDDDDSKPSPPSSPLYKSSKTLDYPNTPSEAILPKNATEPPTPLSTNSTNSSLSHLHSPGGSTQMIEGGSIMSVSLDPGYADYVVEIKRRSVTSSTNEPHIVEDTKKQLAQSAGMLFLQAKILHDMGEQLLAQYRACFEGNSAPRIDFTHQ